MNESGESGPGAVSGTSPQDTVRVAAVQEEVAIGVEKHETGAVRVRKIAREETVEVPMTLRTEQIDVRRIPVNRQVETEYGPRQEGDTWIIPVFEYVPVTEMRLMLKEEVHVTKHMTQQEVVRNVQLRKEELVVEKRDGPQGEWLQRDK